MAAAPNRSIGYWRRIGSSTRARPPGKSAVRRRREERAFLLLFLGGGRGAAVELPITLRSIGKEGERKKRGEGGRESNYAVADCAGLGASANGARCFGSAQKYRLSDRLSKEGRGPAAAAALPFVGYSVHVNRMNSASKPGVSLCFCCSAAECVLFFGETKSKSFVSRFNARRECDLCDVRDRRVAFPSL